MKKKKKTVLIVEDDDDTQELYKDAFGHDVDILKAQTIAEAKELFFAFRSMISLIVLDGHLAGISTVGIAKMFIEHFTGPVFASSISETERKHLMDAGCTHEVQKGSVEGKVRELLQL